MHTKIVTFGIEIVLKLLTTPQQQIQLIDYKIQLCLPSPDAGDVFVIFLHFCRLFVRMNICFKQIN